MKVSDLMRLLRALTTNDRREAAYFRIRDTKYYVHVDIQREDQL